MDAMIDMLDCSLPELDECLKKTPGVASSVLKHRLHHEHRRILEALTEKMEEWLAGFRCRVSGEPMSKEEANKLFLMVSAAQRNLIQIEVLIVDRLDTLIKMYGENAK